jgi:predicted nucleotidyltransferase
MHFMADKDNIISLVKQKVALLAPQARLSLFGSRATDNYHEDSDYDFLIIVPENEWNLSIKQEIENLLLETGLSQGVFINAFVESKENWETDPGLYPLYLNAEKEGILL